MIKRIMIFFKYSSQRLLFSAILKLCLVFQKELLYPHSSQLSIIPITLPVLHLKFPRHVLKTSFLQPVKLFHQDLDDAIALLLQRSNVCPPSMPQIHLLVVLCYSLHIYVINLINGFRKHHLSQKH